MPEGKRARPESTNCPSAALLPEAIFNYVLTVEEEKKKSIKLTSENNIRYTKNKKLWWNDEVKRVHQCLGPSGFRGIIWKNHWRIIWKNH